MMNPSFFIAEQLNKKKILSRCEELRIELAEEKESCQTLHMELASATAGQNDLLQQIKTLENKTNKVAMRERHGHKYN